MPGSLFSRAICALTLTGPLYACSQELAGSGLGWTVEFACDSDRLASDRLHLVMRKGGCGGPVVYDQLLAKGDQAAPTEALTPGLYGFEATALQKGAALAQGCVDASLPDGAAPKIVLTSASCVPSVTAPDAGTPDANVDSAPALSADAGSVDPEVDAALTPVCSGAGCQCERSCPSGQLCQNGACKPTDSGAASCVPRHYAGHDYLFCADKQSWYTARRKCRGWGMGLAIIDDQAENNFVHSFVGGQDRWLGANDLGANDVAGFDVSLDLENIVVGEDTSCVKRPGALGEGTWYWSSAVANVSNDRALCAFADPSAVSCTAEGYQNWREGEPDNKSCSCIGVCAPGQDCALMHGNDGSWGDDACLGIAGYVCESP